MTLGDYRVRRMDKYNLVVERHDWIEKEDAPNEETWRFVGYYGNPKPALRRIQKERMMDGLDRMEDIDKLLTWLEENA